MVIKKQREKLQFLIKGNSSRTDRIAFDFPSEIEFDGLISPFYLPLQWLRGCWRPRSQVSLDDVTRWPGACHPPGPAIRPHSSVLSVQPRKKKSGMFIEKAGSLSEEVKTWGDVVQVCVVSGHSSWYMLMF